MRQGAVLHTTTGDNVEEEQGLAFMCNTRRLLNCDAFRRPDV